MPFKRKEYHKDENCLNCGYPIIGKFCGECGQKAHLHKDSFIHMAAHFMGDYFHYDSKFWLTMKMLFSKPGQITLDFINGKRVRYLSPIQLYIFVTTLFFIITHFIKIGVSKDDSKKNSPTIEINGKPMTAISDSFKNEFIDSLEKVVKDSNFVGVAKKVNKEEKQEVDDLVGIKNTDNGMRIGMGDWEVKEKSLEEYDSVQNTLPKHLKDGFVEKYFSRKSFTANNDKNFEKNFLTLLKNNVPKVFFILMPFFALLLTIIFRKKKLFYVDHLVFSLHFHSIGFVMMLFYYLVNFLTSFINVSKEYVLLVTFIAVGVYLFLSLKKVYPSPVWKLLLKQLFLFFMYLIGLLFSFLIIILITFIMY